jgi:TetR/AcrR family transcriptional repressor of lmrAB and yxaGH operons
MARRTDTREKMVQAGKQLIRERGYEATAFSDVIEASDTPRGSVYFHFPGGKAQLGMDVAEAHAHDQVELIDRIAAEAGSATQLVEQYVDLGREGMRAGDYTRGCGIAPLIIDGAAGTSAEIGEVSRRAFAQMIDRFAFHLVAFGLERGDARQLAEAVITGLQGAMITSRALRSTTPYTAIGAALRGLAARAKPR